jgi:2-dehydro-3-deoxygluconokinase
MLAALRSCHDATRIAFDINYRSALWPRPDELRALIEELASVAEILLVSEEDDRALFGERSPDVALAHYAKMGYTRIVFRRGPLPTQALIDGRQLEVPAIPGISVVDATGAGDAFNAGLIAAQIAGRSWYDSIAYANAAAASVLGTPGGRAVGVTQLTIAELAKRIPTEAHA